MQLGDPRDGSCQDLVLEIVSRVLRCDVEISGSLFKFGATSLAVAVISTELERELAIDIPIRTLYESATIGDLVEWIDARRAASLERR